MEVRVNDERVGQSGCEEKGIFAERTASQTTSEASDEARSLWQNVRRYRRVVGVTFGLASAILLFGFDNVVVGTVSGMPNFQ